MGGVRQNRLPPTLQRSPPLHETIAERGGELGHVVRSGSRVITQQLKTPAVQLAEPALNRNFPDRMLVKEPADDSDFHRLVRSRRTSDFRGRASFGHCPAHQRAVEALELSVVP